MLSLKKVLTKILRGLEQMEYSITTVPISSTYAYSSGQVAYIEKRGKVVTLFIGALKGIKQSTVTLFTLPTGYRPARSRDDFFFVPASAGASCAIRIQISTAGVVTAYGYGDYTSLSAINVRINMSFITND